MEPKSSTTARVVICTKALRSLKKRCNLIGLRQLQRLLRCAACQGTYLGSAATPCIHLHLTQRASRDLISASLSGADDSSPAAGAYIGRPQYEFRRWVRARNRSDRSGLLR